MSYKICYGYSNGCDAPKGRRQLSIGRINISTRTEKVTRPTRGLYTAEDARQIARRRVPKMMFDFVDGSSGDESGEKLNRSTLERVRLLPRVLRNVDQRTLSKNFLGIPASLPFGIAPMGMCNLFWPDADRILAAEAAHRQIPVCLSSAGSTTIENMQEQANGNAWFQIYVAGSMDLAWEMVERANNAAYSVLVFTVDVPQVSRRIRDLRNGFTVPFKIGPRQLWDFATHPRWSVESLIKGVPRPQNYRTSNVHKEFVRGEGRGKVDWNFLEKLRQAWPHKFIVKGVLSPEDALRIRDFGVDAIYVSNHGGRQLNSAPAAIWALPRIRAALGPDYPLLFDSGVRSGEDIVKVLALGADFVMLGRSILYAIGADGARGLSTYIDTLAEDISVTMAQLGVTRIEDIGEKVLAEPPQSDSSLGRLEDLSIIANYG